MFTVHAGDSNAVRRPGGRPARSVSGVARGGSVEVSDGVSAVLSDDVPHGSHRCAELSAGAVRRAAWRARSELRISPARTAVVDSSVEVSPWLCSVPPWR